MDLWDSLGTEGDRIEVVPHRPEWIDLYRQEQAAMIKACAGVVQVVEHIGSTAVHGLVAKPVLDLMPGLAALSDGTRLVAPMAALGYVCRGEYGIPGRLYFEKRRQGWQVAHAHAFEIGSRLWLRHLAFRDYLHTHPDTTREYAELKLRLAQQHAGDREAYTDAKAAFIEDVIARAIGGHAERIDRGRPVCGEAIPPGQPA